MNRSDSATSFKLPKITVTCLTCGTTESFYSTVSLNQFKSKHSGHEIVDGDERPQQQQQPIVAPVVAPLVRDRVQSVARETKLPQKNEGRRVPRVLVDLVNFPALTKPVFRVRGFNGGPEPAFTVTIHDGEERKVRELLARGQYVDFGFSDLLYVWEASAIEYDETTKDRLGITPQATEDIGPGEWRSPPRNGSPDGEDHSSVADTIESMLQASKKEPEVLQPPPPAREEASSPVPKPVEAQTLAPAPSASPVPPVPRGPAVVPVVETLRPATISSPEPKTLTREGNGDGHPEETPQLVRPLPMPEPRPAPEQTPKPKPLELPKKAEQEETKILQKPAVKQPVAKAPVESKPPADDEEGGQLLVSKSWYVQAGEKNTKEAIRISKILKAFRWKVEPVYTIGVMLDDMLNIETNKNQISRTLITSVEDAGYRLTAIALEQGKLVAWFKRRPATEGHGPLRRQGERHEIDEPGAPGDGMDKELRPDFA